MSDRPSTRRRRGAEIDLAAFRANLERSCAHWSRPAAVMVVVKADGVRARHARRAPARPARRAPTGWAWPPPPRRWRCARPATRAGCWPGCTGSTSDLAPLVAADVDVSAQSIEQIVPARAAAAGTAERRARVHLKIDTGLSRNGAAAEDWPELCAAAAEAEQIGAVEVVGVWSHFAAADEPGHPSVPDAARRPSRRRTQVAPDAGLEPALRHLANSAGALLLPEARLRPGAGRASPRTGSTRRPASPPWPASGSGR